MTTPIELAREIIRLKRIVGSVSWGKEMEAYFYCQSALLAQAVIDNPIELVKGKRMPQTPEQFAYVAEKYEEALLREKDENSRLRANLNKVEQKITKSYQRGHAEGGREQKDECARLVENAAMALLVEGFDDNVNITLVSDKLMAEAKAIRGDTPDME